ncbi:MAG TPA: AIR synthase-related protein, partial [Pyrinomonadaceae bacterium]|nr:AIR synthase-related protein [Pyrinomonadaceae bacterium]
TGIELDLSLVPQREQNMTAYEMLLSESQERMLIVAHSGREREVVDIFRKWDLDAVVIGRVRDTGRMQVIHNGATVADIPVSALTDEAPRYERPMHVSRPNTPGPRPKTKDQSTQHKDQTNVLLTLLSSGNVASKHWVYRQYDHMVRTNTAILPGADAAVVRIKETRRALAMTLDGNGRYCAANPREGAKLIVAEAARNVVCVGARPIAITNCLNFASPERPEVMWSFSEVIDGMAEACRALETPVVSGNVSFYNETEGRGILPTPVIGMVGLIEDVRRVVTPGFKKAGDIIALLGTTHDDLSVSEYAVSVAGVTTAEIAASGKVPELDFDHELAVQKACLEAAEAGLLLSAHDCSDGGLAVALAESCFSSLGREATGAEVNLEGQLPPASSLFSESPSRIVISFDPADETAVREIADRHHAPFAILGRAGGTRLKIAVDGTEAVAEDVTRLEIAWRTALSDKVQAEVIAG